jgi:hypothetical protein
MVSASKVHLMKVSVLKIQSCFRIYFVEFVSHCSLVDTNGAVLLHFMLMMQIEPEIFSEVPPLVLILPSFSLGSMYLLHVIFLSRMEPVAQNCFMYL